MQLYQMHFLILSSCLFAFCSCGTVYNNLQSSTGSTAGLQKFKPVFTTALYKANIDVVGNHLSGLLLIKKMPDSTTRIVFSNEIGFKFFDFEFSPGGGFKVYSVIKKMNKRSVIKTLRKDFELVLMQDVDSSNGYIRKDSILLYYIFPQEKGFNCYVTNASGDQLVRLERSSKRKPVVQMIMQHFINGLPDTIGVTHLNFNFTIGLKQIER